MLQWTMAVVLKMTVLVSVVVQQKLMNVEYVMVMVLQMESVTVMVMLTWAVAAVKQVHLAVIIHVVLV